MGGDLLPLDAAPVLMKVGSGDSARAIVKDYLWYELISEYMVDGH
jgi:hypothetical protein